MAKKVKKTYGIAAYNHRLGMVATLYATYTSKATAIYYAGEMAKLGAKQVKVFCDQTKKTVATF